MKNDVFAYFNPRTPCGVRLDDAIGIIAAGSISIHAPLAGCDRQSDRRRAHAVNFNPRTPCGVRPFGRRSRGHNMNFNPRTPCGVRQDLARQRIYIFPFQSTHPLRGATERAVRVRGRGHISIHAPLAGCDHGRIRDPGAACHFNPRTPCGVRRLNICAAVCLLTFQSTHPLRGATCCFSYRSRRRC